MAITYQWTITDTKSVLEQDQFQGYVIVTCNWTLAAKDGFAYATTSGKTTFSDPNPADFVPFNDVSTDQMVEWITATLGQSTIDTMKASLAAQVEKQLNKPISYLPQAV